MAGPVRFNGQVILDPAKLAKVISGEQGLMTRQLIKDGERVKQEARRLVGVSKPDPVPRKNPRKPGTLRDSIVKRMVTVNGHVACQVGSQRREALWHHEGTQAHVITANKKPFLVFWWPKTGKVMYVKTVHHPGTKPNRFLINALRVVSGKYRWKS